MKVKLFIGMVLWLFLYAPSVKGQEKISYVKADSLTYAFYLNGHWNDVIQVGKKAIHSDVDYFYLRMRIAYAYFQKQQYRRAITHYKQALKQNPADLNALYYLMHTYEYSGRLTDAVALSEKIDSMQLPDLFNRYKKTVISGGLIYIYNTAKSNSNQKLLSEYFPTSDGIQKATKSFHVALAYLTNRLGRFIVLNHQLSFMTKKEYSLSVFNSSLYNVPDQSVTQFNYNLKATVTLAKGFTLSPVYNTVSVRIPFEDLSISPYKESASVGGFVLNQHFSLFSLGASYTVGTVNQFKQTQYGSHLTLYPLANLNLYYSFNAFMQQQKIYGVTENTFIQKHLLGFKVASRWCVEASSMPIQFNNFYNPLNGALWNGLEGSKNVYNLKNIFSLKNYKTSFMLNIGMYDSVSEYKPHDTPGTHQNKNTYTNYNITAGISWKL